MLRIENDYVALDINPHGGTMTSFVDKITNSQLLWQANDSRSWNEQDVVIFPFVARTKDGYYTIDGKRYDMPLHGLAVYRDFSVVQHSEDTLVIEQKWDNKTLQAYPYKFLLRLTFKLIDRVVNVTYEVENLDNKDFPFMLGAHPGIALYGKEIDDETSIEGNKIVFDKEQDAILMRLNETGHYILREESFNKFKELELSKGLMRDYKTLIFKNIDCKNLYVELKNGTRVTFDIGSAPYLAFWTQEDYGAYICVEPWWGIPDFDTPVREFKDKQGANILSRGSNFTWTYKMSI